MIRSLPRSATSDGPTCTHWRQLLGLPVILLLFVCAVMLPCRAQGSSNVSLSSEEQTWLRQNPTVRVGVFVGDHLPGESWGGGRPEGLGVDYARLLASRAGLRLEFHPFTDWEAVVFGDGASLRYDLLLSQAISSDRADRFIYLRPYAAGRMVMVARRNDERMRDEGDLQHARIAVERTFRLPIQVLHTRFPRATLMYARDGREALDMVARGEADAYVGSTPARTLTLLRQRPRDDLALLGPLSTPPTEVALAVNAARPMLARILGKAEQSVAPEELARLRERWGVQSGPQAGLPRASGLTDDERRWLSALPELRVGYEVDRYPYTFVDSDGKPAGLSVDYAERIASMLGLRLRLVPADDWTSLRRMIDAHEIDLVLAATPEDFRSRSIGLSHPYERFPVVIVAPLRNSSVGNMEDLEGRVVAAREEAGLLPQLRTMLRASRMITVGSNEAGLDLVARGEADAFVGTLPAIDALVRTRYAATLRVAGPTGLEQELSFAVSGDYARLLPLIDRALTNMAEPERQAIRSHWLSVEYHYSKGLPWGWVLGGALAVSLVLSIIGISYLRQNRAWRAQVAAERNLALQLAFQHALLENIPYPVFVKDAHGRYLAINRAYETAFGCERSQVIGRTLIETRHLKGLDAEALHRSDLALLEAGGHARRELSMLNAQGVTREMLLWLHTFARSSDEPSLLGTLVDVTDIREAEARARASEQRLADITQALPSAVFQLRVLPDGSRRFTYAAGDTRQTIGLTAEQLIADEELAFSHIHPDDRALTSRMVEMAARTLKPMPPFDVRVEVNGELRWIRTEGGEPRRADDGAVEWSGYWIDTTQSHRQEQALRAAKAQAEAAVAARSAFLAMMSHEIRTPMAGVIGLIELMAQDPRDEEQKHMLQMAQDSAGALLQIVDDILDFSRIESGRLELEVAPFDLRMLADSVVGLLALRAQEKGVRLCSVLDWRLAAQFEGDATRVRQVVMNLMSNALKFTHAGHIELSIELVDEEEGMHQVLRIAVADTGIGIPPQQLGRLFQPFTQAEASTTRRFGGTGLGLSICRRLADLMGGNIHLESAVGVGTRAVFEVTLPVVRRMQPHEAFAGRTAVVCTQDSKFVRELSNALSALGFNLIESDSRDLREFTGSDAALLVLDAELEAGSPLPEVPRILLTNVPDPRGFHVEEGRIVLCSNPLLWRAARGACLAAFGLQHEEESGRADAAAGRAARLLVAEDHPVNRALIARQLEQLGYAYDLVEDGQQALDALATGHYRLLLTDCHMPHLDGYELSRRLREREKPGTHMPIIALSASALPEEVQRCRDAGMDDFLAKPVRLEALRTMLQTYLGASSPDAGEDTPVPTTGEDAIAFLSQAFGGTRQAREMLGALLHACYQDMTVLEQAMRDGDAEKQEHLLHRCEGALRLTGAELYPDGKPRDATDRRDAIARRLVELDQLLQGPGDVGASGA
ncbi:ATP-binding protein [Lysobacter sp.]|uniref:ATP-binding protein n=1 Tax=Lysobacter sp. TaxID=72226 RepID=UPI002D5D9C4F|nr:transporter substrate-binding domain-containing protein [Lysobacter sp.]HZX76180.1 transporter substrate-binding domain-containing protein [Lysobacter sp.]